MKEALRRISKSKKAIYAAVPMLISVVTLATGQDVGHQALLVVDAFFAMLLVAQTMLDMRWGSQSDRSGDYCDG